MIFLCALCALCALSAVVSAGCRSEVLTADVPLESARRMLEEERPYLPWFSGVVAHRPCGSDESSPQAQGLAVCRSPTRFEPRMARRLSGLGMELRRSGLVDRGGPELWHVQGLLRALSARVPGRLDQSVELLAKSARTNADPASRNDLAAVLLVRSDLHHDPADLLSALRHATEALELRPGMVEARFNRALALEALTLWTEASREWARVERAAEGSGWRQEAARRRRHCRILADRAVTAEDSIAHGERKRGEAWLGEWGRAIRAGDPARATDALAEAHGLAARVAERSGDRLLLDSVARVKSVNVEARGDLGRLGSGHAALADARGGAPYSGCEDGSLSEARFALSAAATPYRAWAELDTAICAFFAKDFPRAEAALRRVEEVGETGSYPVLLARAGWIRGLIRMVQGRFDEALASLQAAAEGFRGAGEIEHDAYLQSMIAETYRRIGARRTAWKPRLQALRGRVSVASPERRFTIFEEVVETLIAENDPRSALSFAGEQVAAAEQAASAGDWDLLTYTLLDRRALLLGLGKVGLADADLDAAEAAWSRLGEGEESRLRLGLELDLERAAAAGDGEAQLSAIRRGREFFAGGREGLQRQEGDRGEILQLYLREAALHRRRGDVRRAEEALASSFEEVERQRDRLARDEDRATYTTQATRLFEEMVALQVDDLEDPWAALGYLERAAALESPGAGREAGATTFAASLASGSGLPRRLAPEATVIRYGRLGDRLLTWILSPTERRFEVRASPRGTLDQRLTSLRSLVSDPQSGDLLDDLLAELGAELLPEAVAHLSEGAELIIIPEESTDGVPFAALYPAGSATPLGATATISMAPTLAGYLRAPRTLGPPRRPASDSVLVVSDPRFDRSLFPDLADLRGAELAGPSLHSTHAGSVLLSGEEATEEAVLAELQRHSIVHFEGHAVVDPTRGLRSGILLASPAGSPPDRREASLLRAEELAALDLSHLRLVVLAACSTAVGVHPESSQVANLATAFLDAGVPAVVASLWPVDAEASALLHQALHRHLADGKEPAVALRLAQEEMRRQSDPVLAHPRTWAAFEVFTREPRDDGLETKMAAALDDYP